MHHVLKLLCRIVDVNENHPHLKWQTLHHRLVNEAAVKKDVHRLCLNIDAKLERF